MTDDPTTAHAAGHVVRIIARPVPWPSLEGRSGREGLRMRWDAITEGGAILFPATEYPLQDAAHVLSEMGLSADTMVTMRQAGKGCDLFAPMPLAVPAAAGARRADRRASGRSRGPTTAKE